MSPTPITLDAAGFRITGLAAQGTPGMPLIVCLPGGSYNAHYFDVPGYSLLQAAQRAGFPAVALDRPGYGGSDALEGEVSFRRNAEVLSRAIQALWQRQARDTPGIVLFGHSMGGAIAMHIGTLQHDWPLLGLSITAIHYDAPGSVTNAQNSVPANTLYEFSRAQRIQLMYGPEGTYDPSVIDDARVAESPVPVAELQEVVGGWPRNFPGIAAQIHVPVQYALAEYDHLWKSTHANVAAFGAAFTAAPSVAAQRIPGCGHNIDHHYAGAAFHGEQLEFARSLTPPRGVSTARISAASVSKATDPVLDRILSADAGDRRILLRGAQIVTMTSRGEVTGDVLVCGDRIAEIAEGGLPVEAEAGQVLPDGTVVVHAAGAILIPGLIDSHIHGWEGQLRGLAPDADLGTYMEMGHQRLAPAYRPEDLALGERLTAAHAINAGTTTIIDNSHNNRSRAHADAAVGGLKASGIRAVFAAGPALFGDHEDQMPGDLLRLRDEFFRDPDGLVSLRLFSVSPDVDTLRFGIENGFAVSAELGDWVPNLDKLASSGLLRPNQTYNHCARLPTELWKAIADSGATVDFAPRSDGHYGIAAHPPVLEVARYGLQPGISSDNELSYGHDLFTEMRVLLTAQRGVALTEAAGGPDPVAPYTTLDVLRAATVGGALCAGLSSQIGAIEEGRKADLVLLRTDLVNTLLHGSAVGTVVNYAGISNVDTVLINGVPRKWRGQLVGLDYNDLAEQGERSREYILTAAGLRE
jgi:5-methylthioadenosine/S-adenosylhomocysteine deaminase